jgi:hypothetical protein
LRPDALQSRQGIDDPALRRFESHTRSVHVGRHHLDSEPPRFEPEFAELVGVPHVERHGGGQKLDGIIGLQICGLVADDRIGGGVGLVEAVAGELGDEVEDRHRVGASDPALDRAFDESGALRVHLRLDLLAHGASQQVGFAE